MSPYSLIIVVKGGAQFQLYYLCHREKLEKEVEGWQDHRSCGQIWTYKDNRTEVRVLSTEIVAMSIEEESMNIEESRL